MKSSPPQAAGLLSGPLEACETIKESARAVNRRCGGVAQALLPVPKDGTTHAQDVVATDGMMCGRCEVDGGLAPKGRATTAQGTALGVKERSQPQALKGRAMAPSGLIVKNGMILAFALYFRQKCANLGL
jgi:hypothetical protein